MSDLLCLLIVSLLALLPLHLFLVDLHLDRK